jgi:hypothetical protein
MNRKRFATVVLFVFVLAALTATPLSSQQGGIYDPWLDNNGDGRIDVNDLHTLAQAYGTSGDPTRNLPSDVDYCISTDGTNFGAVRYDGKLLWSSTNASFTINSAIIQSDTRSIYIKSGTYGLSSPLICKSDLRIDCDPKTELKQTADNLHLIKIDASSNVKIENLIFDGSNQQITFPNEYTGLIYVTNSYQITFNAIEVKNQGRASGGRPPAALYMENVHDIRICDSYIHDNQGSGIVAGKFHDKPYNLFIENNNITDNTLQYLGGVFGGIVLANVQNSTIAHNKIRRATWGIECVGSNFKGNTILDNQITGSTNSSVVVEDGIEIYDEGSSDNKIIGNTISEYGYSYPESTAIDVGKDYLSYQANGAYGNVVTGNTIKLAGGCRGIQINGRWNVVSNNIIAGGNSSSYGILESGVSNFNTILANDVSGVITPSKRVYCIGGQSIVRFNVGFETESWGEVGVTGAVNHVWVAHGLAGNPWNGGVQVTPESPCGNFWITGINATHFSINFEKQPQQYTWSFMWEAKLRSNP